MHTDAPMRADARMHAHARVHTHARVHVSHLHVCACLQVAHKTWSWAGIPGMRFRLGDAASGAEGVLETPWGHGARRLAIHMYMYMYMCIPMCRRPHV